MTKLVTNRIWPLLVVATGLLAIAAGFKAIAAQTVTATAPAPEGKDVDAAPEDESLRQSADNNISFPVDI